MITLRMRSETIREIIMRVCEFYSIRILRKINTFERVQGRSICYFFNRYAEVALIVNELKKNPVSRTNPRNFYYIDSIDQMAHKTCLLYHKYLKPLFDLSTNKKRKKTPIHQNTIIIHS